ncbi:MAG TPA: division plane positioning ATPase MipZ [Pirellulales bacterium]|jgi:chromosome partitioning protein
MKTLLFANTKGGVGKSTLAVHLAVWLFDRGAKVALLDVDRQSSASQWIAEAEPKITVKNAGTPEDVVADVQSLAQSHDFVVADGPGGLNDSSRTLLILADLAIFPTTPSVLDLRSVAEATELLKYAQALNGGKVQGRLVLNRMKTRCRISRELADAAPSLGLSVAKSNIRDLQPYCDAAQQGTVVTRMGYKAKDAATELTQLFVELMTDKLAFLEDPSPETSEENTRHEHKTLAK